MKMDIKNRRAGFYFLGNPPKPFVSVTQVLDIIAKPQLQYWMGREVYRALAVNPALSEKEALAAPYASRDKAASRGSLVHSVIQAYKAGNKVLKVPEHQGYVDAFFKWAGDFKPEIIENEKTVVCKSKGYAGTLDLLANINGKPHIIDFKTNKDGALYDEVELQLSAYYKALVESTNGFAKSDNGYELMAVGLSENGNYQAKTFLTDVEPFLSALSLWVWKNKELCKKMGYGGEPK